ncbi:hypothetical protein O6H91_10G083700 [Diphasiastrum complanatum]|uniref:Uncharacterized protein n=1 Tax=Diphasiastrum complanatum TaxID=34168 RepID=A0ACC2CJ51_DIPCM|nr:hypothetical protein O6H91_10G083700 [Diphasiastrum complanatum]
MVAEALSLLPTEHLRQQQDPLSKPKYGGVPPLPASKNDEPIARKPRNREISSRYKLISQAAAGSSHRCSSPDFGHTCHSLDVLPRRAVSADRKHATTPLSMDTRSSNVVPKNGKKISKQLWPTDRISVSKNPDCMSASKETDLSLNGWHEGDVSLKAVNGLHGSTFLDDISQQKAVTAIRRPLMVRSIGTDEAENIRPAIICHDKHAVSRAENGNGYRVGSHAVSRSLDFFPERQRSGGDPKTAAHKAECTQGQDLCHVHPVLEHGEIACNEPSTSFHSEAADLMLGSKLRDNSKPISRVTVVPVQFWHHPGSRITPSCEVECMGASASEAEPPKGIRRTKVASATAASPPLSPYALSKSMQFVSSVREVLPKTRVSQNVRHISQSINSSGILDRSKGKKNPSQHEEAHYLRILQNRLLQWRLVNAQAESVNAYQQTAAEGVLLQIWETLQQDHSIALAAILTALEAAILRLPLVRGAKADIPKLKEILDSASVRMNDVSLAIEVLQAKAESVATLLYELAEVVVHERSLLDESGDLFHILATLEVEERSLKTYLIQVQYEQNKPAREESVGWGCCTTLI